MAQFASSEAGKKGGAARAKRLSKEERSAIARKAAMTRHGHEIQEVAYPGTLKLGAAEIECAVLKDGTRLISQRGFARGLGASKPMSMTRRGAGKLPAFLNANNLKPFISKELVEAASPIPYLTPQRGNIAYGIRAEATPKICAVWLKARDAGVLKHNQIHLAEAADVIIRGLAEVGIVALIDEATGYQADRERDALAKILEAFVAKELRKWVKTFDPAYYEGLCRLWGSSLPTSKKSIPFLLWHSDQQHSL